MAIRRGIGEALNQLTERKLKRLVRAGPPPALGVGDPLPAEKREGKRPTPTTNIGGA